MASKQTLPPQMLEVFARNVSHMQRAAMFYSTSEAGVSIAAMTSQYIPMLIEDLKKKGAVFPPGTEEPNAEQMAKTAGLCAQQARQGFPELHAMMAVLYWGGLEALIEDVLVALFQAVPTVLKNECFEKITIPLAEYERIDKDERMRLLFRKLEEKVRSSDRLGVSGYETLLQFFGIQVAPKEDVRRPLFELSQLRNVIVHREHIADRRLVESCPGLGVSIGQRVVIIKPDFLRYVDAVERYSQTFYEKCCDVYGLTSSSSSE